MSILASALVRRIDRLAWRAHAFHRFAHHPVCDRYAGEVVMLGRRTRVCRGCASFLLGGALGLAIGIALRPAVALVLLLGACATALALLSLARRLPKLVGRLFPALLGAAAWGSAWTRALGGDRRALVSAIALTAIAALGIAVYRRRGPSRASCADCPERSHQPCSGFAPIVLRERAFQRLAQRWIDGSRRQARPSDPAARPPC